MEPNVSVMQDSKQFRERWIRFKAPSVSAGAITAGVLTSLQLPGHRWMDVRVRSSRKSKSDNPGAISSGRAASVTVVIRHTNDRIEALSDAALEAFVAAASDEAGEALASAPPPSA
jgi:hypothetical protein